MPTNYNDGIVMTVKNATEYIFNLCQGYQVSEVFFEACHRNIFSIISDKTVHSAWIFDKIDVKAIPGKYFFNSLEEMGLIVRDGEKYSNSSFSKKHLTDSSPFCLLAFVKQCKFQRRYWQTLGKALSSGEPTAFDCEMAGDGESRSFIDAMEEKSALTCETLINELGSLDGRILDVGCGSGQLLKEIYKRSKDMPPVLEGYDIKRSIDIAKEGPSYPISFFEGNFLEDALPQGPYELVILSNVVHMYAPDENRKLFEKISDILVDGGKLAVFDLFLDQGDGSLWKNLFSLNMSMGTFGGRTYSISEIIKDINKSKLIEDKITNIGFLGTLILSTKRGNE